jgi:hypothetical protein
MKGRNKWDKKRRRFGGGEGDKHNAVGADKIGSCITESSFLECMVAAPHRPLACVMLVSKQQTAVSLGIPNVLRILNFYLYRIRHEVFALSEWGS